MSDFSLDAIECGIVKLPRMPVGPKTRLGEKQRRVLWSIFEEVQAG
jgi:hypothetical protein